MTTLRPRVIKDLTVRGLAEDTRKSYLHAVGVSALALQYNRSFDQISFNEIQDNLIHLHQERHLS